MNFPRLLGSAGLAVLSLFALALSPQDPKPVPQHQHKAHDAAMAKGASADAKIIADCMVCCSSCAGHCAMLAGEGKKEHVTTLMLQSDCATICAATATLVACGSSLAGPQLEACAKACDACAAECEKSSDAMMKECAETCRKCATHCRNISGQRNATPK